MRENLRMGWEDLFSHEVVKDHQMGSIIQVELPPAHIRKILSSVQTEIERKQVDLITIFSKYQAFNALDKNTFTALLGEISPSVTTH